MHGVIVGHVKAKYSGMGNMKFSIGIYRFFYLLFYGYKYRPNSLNSVSEIYIYHFRNFKALPIEFTMLIMPMLR